MPNQCPLCKLRVSDWMMASGKAEIINQEVVHKSCLIDYKLKHGKDYKGEGCVKTRTDSCSSDSSSS